MKKAIQKKEYNNVYDFAVDDEDAKYYDKQNISFEDIFENMEDCFKYVISTVNYLCEQQCEVMDRINTINTQQHMTAKKLIDKYKSQDFSKRAVNLMGCSEHWYDASYAICNTFSEEELLKMEEKEIDDLIRLAETMGEAFY